ncbi:MAG: hypothetical protein WD118_04955 [Phycisphaeraceae bacterium]
MPVFLDDEQLDLPGDNLAAVLAAARDRVTGDGRVMVEVHLDGEPVPAEQLDRAESVAVEGVDVHLYSADPRELARMTLEQVRGRLGEVGGIQAEAAELLQQDQTAGAMDHVREAIEVWLQTQQAVAHTATLLDIDLDTLAVGDMTFDAITAELIERLQAVKELLAAGDGVALADTLAYEWPELVERWDRLIAALLERI